MKANRKSHPDKTDRDRKRNNTKSVEDQVAYLASLIDNISDALISTDIEFNILEWNPAAEGMYGWVAAEVMGHSLQEFIQSEFIDTTREDVIQTVMEQGIWKGEVIHNRKDGDRFPVMASVSLVRDKAGKPIGFVAINRDITERKKVEKELRESQGLLQAIMDHFPGLISAKDLDGNVIMVNRYFEVLEGPPPREFIGKNVYDLFPQEVADVLWENDLAAQRAGQGLRSEETVSHKDGLWHTYMTTKFPLYKNGGKMFATCAISTDITERKQAEEALREQQLRQEKILDSMFAYVGLFSLDGIALEVNRTPLEAAGLNVEDVIGEPFADAYWWSHSEATQAQVRDAIRRAASGETVREDFQVRIFGGQIIIVDAVFNPLRDSSGKIIQVVGSGVDITERKRVEGALRKSEQTFSVIFNKAPFAAGLTRLSDGAYVEANEEFERVFGFRREEIIGKTSLDLGMYPDPEVRARSAALFREQGFVHNLDVRLQTRTGEIRDVLINSDLVGIGGEKYILTTANDITERKQVQEKIQAQNQRLKILREIDRAILAAESVEAIVGIALSHIRELIECRRANLTLIDWGTNDLVIFEVRTVDETTIPKGSRLPIALFEDIIQTLSQNQPIVFSDLLALANPMPGIQRLLKDGLRSTCSLPLFSQGKLIGMFSMHSETPGFFDEEKIDLGREVANQVAIAITQSRLFEALREQQTLQKDILDGMLTFVGLISLEGIVLEVNRAALAAVGLKAEDLIGKPLAELNIWAHSEVTQARVQEAIRRSTSGEIVREDFQARIVGDQVITVDVVFNPLRDSSGHILQVVVSGVDITERKRAEEALRENESRLQSIIDTEPECVKVLDLNGRLLEMNPAGLAMIEADRLDDVLGQEVANLVVPNHRMAFKNLTHSVSEGRTGTLIFEIEGLKGTHRWLETHAVPLRDDKGTVTAILGITLDITERKRAEGQIQRQIQHLRALHTIDTAISSSFDLRMTLGVLVNEVISQLGVDAADILLFNQPAQILEYAAARGFHSNAVQHTHLRLGEGFAGRAIVERRTIHIQNMMEAGGNLVKSLLVAGESFVTYIGAPLIAKGQVEGVLEIFHRTPLEPDQEWMDFLEALAKQAAIAIDNAQLLQNLQYSNTELIVAYDATLEGWSRAMDLRDKETEGHTKRVTEMAVHLAQLMGIREMELIHIRRGGMLHDIGKLGVPDSILLKPDKLTDDEWEVMRLHPKLAYEMLSPITYLKSALDIPYCHHEKWDGSGYPRGLKGNEIPLSARIFAVADVWDALTNDRPYRRAWPKEQVAEYLKEQSGKYFDPHVVEIFLNMIDSES